MSWSFDVVPADDVGLVGDLSLDLPADHGSVEAADGRDWS